MQLLCSLLWWREERGDTALKKCITWRRKVLFNGPSSIVCFLLSNRCHWMRWCASCCSRGMWNFVQRREWLLARKGGCWESCCYLLWLIRPWLKLRKQRIDTGTDTTISTISTHTTRRNNEHTTRMQYESFPTYKRMSKTLENQGSVQDPDRSGQVDRWNIPYW